MALNALRKLPCPRRNLQCYVRRYYGTTASGSNTGADSKGSGRGNKENETKRASAVRSPLYDARKFSHPLPDNKVRPPFDPVPDMPTGIFRSTDGEVIGPLAGKCAYYRNPEYYSFHHMSFFDLHMFLLPYRKPQIKTGRKP